MNLLFEKQYEEGPARAAAENIDWANVFNCKKAKPTAHFMQPKLRGAVCWNQARIEQLAFAFSGECFY